MKSNLKRFLVVLCVLAMSLTMVACGKEKNVIEVDEEWTSQFCEGLIIYNFNEDFTTEYVESRKYDSFNTDESYELVYSIADTWQKAMPDLGTGPITIRDKRFVSDEDSFTCYVDIAGSSGRTATVEFIFDEWKNPTSVTVNVDRTVSENMKSAAMNTVIGMGTVFAVLILIAFIISLFKYIGVIEKKLKEKKDAPDERKEAIDKAVTQIIENEAQLEDDTELIAVISAAIAAYEESAGNSGDGYVVRSIKRRS